MTTQAPRVGARRCPIIYDPGSTNQPVTCGGAVRAGHLMCPRHWAQVPKPIQNDVWRTWRAWNRDGTDEQWVAYEKARDAALDVHRPTTPGTPSESLTWDDLDAAALVLVVAPDGGSRMWYGGDHEAAGRVLRTVYADLTAGAVTDARPT